MNHLTLFLKTVLTHSFKLLLTGGALAAASNVMASDQNSSAAHDCTVAPLVAKYSITTHKHEHPDESHGHTHRDTAPITREFNLWRKSQNRVAHEDVNRKMTEVWGLTKNNRIVLARHFDQHSRAIEYSSADMSGQNDWNAKLTLISKVDLDKVTPVKSAGLGCERTEHYIFEQSSKSRTSITWLPELKLIKTMTITTPQSNTHWQLSLLDNDTKKIASFFASKDRNQTTDYADIGDNESDPFLNKMINLGFVEHGASGFYTSDGKAIGHGHNH